MSVNKESLIEAVKALRNSPKRNFLQSIELLISLKDIDFKKPESKINELIELPHPLTKPVKICVFGTGELALKAKKAGVDLVLGKEEIENLGKDKKLARKIAEEYDHFLAEAPLMPLIGKTIGSFLGPRGKMPVPVPPNASIEDLINRYRKLVRVRTRDQPAIRCKIATEDMKDEEIAENAATVISIIEGKLEKKMKNIKSIMLKLTMGSPVKVSLKEGED
ncbi:MAG: 50S ribosomal protein L1 [Candidatus Bathyarchaeia archaeon]|nr:50S ribosomal protein L1 [Candidatus Bathyarchaeota archaeon]